LDDELAGRGTRLQLAHYKVPRYIKFVEAFPMTVTGKIQKFLIRKQSIEDLELERATSIETV
jgi:fatty-acyl-CoA synthase